MIGLGVAVAGGFAADSQLGNRAPWRFWNRPREEADALALGRRALSNGQYRRAIRAVSRIQDGSPNEAEALTIRGLAEAELEEVGPARRSLERAWQLRPNATAARVLAAIYLSAYEHLRGLQMLLNASRLDPSDVRPWYAMGELVYLRLRRYDQAREAFEEALKRDPGHPESRIGLVDALLKSHRPEEAEPILKAVLHERPDDSKVLLLAAELALEMGREPEAEHHLDRTLALDPDRRAALLLHARVQFRRGRAQEALAEAQRASTLEPNDLEALNLLGSIESALGLKEQAARTLVRRHEVERRNERIESLMQEILERPDDPEPRCRLGQTAREAGLRPLAIQSYQAALAMAPDCRPARQGLIELGLPRSQLPPATTSASGGRR
jgi:tetratricopeptide (TPR) repeat protein